MLTTVNNLTNYVRARIQNPNGPKRRDKTKSGPSSFSIVVPWGSKKQAHFPGLSTLPIFC